MRTLNPSTEPARHATISVGVDVVDVPRIGAVLERDGAAERLLTAAELAYCRARPAVAEHVAARFAAKEAVLKALGTGFACGVRWTDVEVVNDPGGRPRVRLHRTAAALASRAGLVAMEISLSHTAALAIAHATALWSPHPSHDPGEQT